MNIFRKCVSFSGLIFVCVILVWMNLAISSAQFLDKSMKYLYNNVNSSNSLKSVFDAMRGNWEKNSLPLYNSDNNGFRPMVINGVRNEVLIPFPQHQTAKIDKSDYYYENTDPDSAYHGEHIEHEHE